jgi:hypothetical protein
MKKLIAIMVLLFSAVPAAAQNTTGLVVPACGSTTPLYLAGRPGAPTVDVNGNLCTGGSMPGTVPGTAPGSTSVVGGTYSTVAPTYTTGQAGPLRFDVKGRLIQTVEKRATYSAAIQGLVLAAAATDVFCVSGSASKTIIIKHIAFAGTATSSTVSDMLFLKRSTANTGGTSTSPAITPHDSTNAAGTATILAYTVNPTTGTLVGNFEAIKFTLPTTTIQINERATTYGIEEDQGIILNNATESACLNFNGQTVAGASINVSVEWREVVQ